MTRKAFNTLPLLCLAARNSFGRQLTFQRRGRHQIEYDYTVPTDAQTPAQLAQRELFTAHSVAYNSQFPSNASKESYAVGGQYARPRLSGWDYFLQTGLVAYDYHPHIQLVTLIEYDFSGFLHFFPANYLDSTPGVIKTTVCIISETPGGPPIKLKFCWPQNVHIYRVFKIEESFFDNLPDSYFCEFRFLKYWNFPLDEPICSGLFTGSAIRETINP